MSRKLNTPTDRDFEIVEWIQTPHWFKRLPTLNDAKAKFGLSKGRLSQIVQKVRQFEEVNN